MRKSSTRPPFLVYKFHDFGASLITLRRKFSNTAASVTIINLSFPGYLYCDASLVQIRVSGVCLLATRVLSIKWLQVGKVAKMGTKLIQNLRLGHENWLLTGQYILLIEELRIKKLHCFKIRL